MNLAVKLYGPNDKGIPEIWPEKIKELKEGETVKEDYILMTKEEYELYVSEKQSIYDQWKQTQEPVLSEIEQLNALIEILQPFEKVQLRQAGFMEVLKEQSLYEAYIILFNLSPSGNLKNIKDQMIIILNNYQTPLK